MQFCIVNDEGHLNVLLIIEKIQLKNEKRPRFGFCL